MLRVKTFWMCQKNYLRVISPAPFYFSIGTKKNLNLHCVSMGTALYNQKKKQTLSPPWGIGPGLDTLHNTWHKAAKRFYRMSAEATELHQTAEGAAGIQCPGVDRK